MKRILSKLTKHGRVSVPASLRKQLRMKPGDTLLWENVSENECRLRVVLHRETGTVGSMRGFMKRFQTDSNLPATTAGWMNLLRHGERE
jgi:AbrB family looped-hinge helix DNA binding protein